MAARKCVLITGGSSGIGLATAIEVAGRGYRSVATVRSETKADIVLKAAASAGVGLETAVLEITEAAACERLIERYQPYGLVNNAGINEVAAIEDTTDDDARRMFEINTLAPMRLARLAIPGMRAQGGGRIVNVSSAEGRVTLPLLGWYQATKHALEGASGALRVEVASAGITVSSVQPGSVDTPLWDKGFWVEDELFADSGYVSAYDRLKVFMDFDAKFQIPPNKVALLIAKILTARRPRAQYLVGADARGLVLTHNLVPASARDRLHRLAFRL